MQATGAIRKQEKDRGRVYTAKQKRFLKLFTKNDFKDLKSCAFKAGYKDNHWNLVESLKEDIKNIAHAVLLGSAPEAALAVSDILTSNKPIPNAQTKLQAAREVLDRTGIIKEEKMHIDHNVTGGLFLLPVKQPIAEEEDGYINVEYEEV